MDKKLKDEFIHNITTQGELFLNEYNWESSKNEKIYNFKIRLNTNNTILFSSSTNSKNNEKIYFEQIYFLKELLCYDRFKNNENIKDIYIYLYTIIQDNQFEFELIGENELKLIIKPYTTSEKLIEFILPKKTNCNKRCEICDRMHSGINYLRFIRDNNHNIINSNNNICYHINTNYNNINNDSNNDKNIIANILKEINLLKKENSIKDEEIKKLRNELLIQNTRLTKENEALREEIKNISKKNKNDNKDNNILLEPNLKEFIDNDKNETIVNQNKKNNLIRYNIKKKLFLKTFKASTEIFNNNPNELKYHSCIVKDLSAKGVNDIFEVFLSNKDNQQYLISKNAKNHNLDIILLKDNKIVTSLKGHNNSITMVRYFMNYKGKNEYLISADIDKIVLVWDINDNYKILHTINTEYVDNNIYSCYLFFDNFDNNYIFTSCGLNRYIKNETSYTKMYSFKDGKYEKDIIDSNLYNTYYLLIWYNENEKINYLVELCQEVIIITNFNTNYLYAKLSPIEFHVLKYYSGFIYNYDKKNEKDFLCCSTSNGCIVIWDLNSKDLVYFGKISKVELYNIIQWNKKFAIVSGGKSKYITIFDLESFKEVNKIETRHSSNINCIKKIVHPIYGESLLSSGNDHKIRLWTI